MRLRFAPAPTNKLHIGNIKAVVINWLYTIKNNGELLLRIDDTQVNDEIESNIKSIYQTLEWLNIKPDKVFQQSTRKEIYKSYFELLKKNGYIYPCYETKEELDNLSNRIYKKTEKNIYNDHTPTYYRFELTQQFIEHDDLIQGYSKIKTININDPIILINTNNQYTYLFASSVDDIHENITHIIRGSDHSTNTLIQKQIMQSLIITAAPNKKLPEFGHYGLFLSDNKEKISKRKGNVFTDNLKSNILQTALIKYLAISGVSKGMNINDHHSLSEIIDFFDIKNLSNKNIIYDEHMLLTINKTYLQNLSIEKAKTFYPDLDIKIWDIIRNNIYKVSDIQEWVQILDLNYEPINMNFYNFSTIEQSIIQSVFDILNKPKILSENTLSEQKSSQQNIFKELQSQLKNKFFKPLRLCLTYRLDGPSLIDIFTHLPLAIIIKRLKQIIDHVIEK